MTVKEASERLLALSQEQGYVDFIGRLLLDMCAVPSVPGADLEETAEQESRVFDVITRALAERGVKGMAERSPIRPEISRHRSFTFPYYAGTDEAYKGRANLLHRLEPEGTAPVGRSVALNAHIDTVAPHIAPSIQGDRLFGRGACDDKGCCAAIIGALSLLRSLDAEHGIRPAGRVISMFVIDEETGGNGSLSLACDRELGGKYDTLLVVESTEGQLHPANRGAVWYKTVFPGGDTRRLRLVLDVVRELELEGRRLKAESDHPLFLDRPVQTCHGVLGPFGEPPSAICGKVSFRLTLDGNAAALRPALDEGLAQYIRDYGDKTRVKDPVSGKPKVDHHYDLEPHPDGATLTVWGCTGHMGAILENDGAITKAAFMLLEAWSRFPVLSAVVGSKDAPGDLVLEGGQGFLPTHTIEAVEARITAAVGRAFDHAEGAYRYCGGRPVVSFNKLHNDAFDGSPDSQAMQMGLRAARSLDIPVELPIRGMKVSCDARLFARKYPDKPVITVGPGTLTVAHSDSENIDLVELRRSSAFLALYVLLLSGALEEALPDRGARSLKSSHSGREKKV
jgi:acetylornithine deacetylase/succinyl-diaminopimelate desuccinylase-like protein